MRTCIVDLALSQGGKVMTPCKALVNASVVDFFLSFLRFFSDLPNVRGAR